MKIAVVGAGFTGLTAAYRLSTKHQVTVFEKEKTLGGLSGTFKLPYWLWPVEKHYHHWFATDQTGFNLIKELGLDQKLFFPKSLTSLYYENRIYPFNTPFQILAFSPLSFCQRLRLGAVSLYLKLLPESLGLKLEKQTAVKWLPKYFGAKTYEIVWQPLLQGKFSQEFTKVNMAWFWARVKKRTLSLGYLQGGYQTLLEALGQKIAKNKGQIKLGKIFQEKDGLSFDKIIFTAPSPLFFQTYSHLPKDYKKNFSMIKYLHAYNLLIISKEKFLKETYWLNINDQNFPFVGLIQHTNMINSRYYGGDHLLWVANYLPSNHPFFKMSKQKLYQYYLPYLKRINPNFNPPITKNNLQLFFGPYAQPIFPINYSQIKPDLITPLQNVYLANMDMVYPWDRGVNYAIELGEKVAKYILNLS